MEEAAEEFERLFEEAIETNSVTVSAKSHQTKRNSAYVDEPLLVRPQHSKGV